MRKQSLFLLPICGASREASRKLFNALNKSLPDSTINLFDTEKYLNGYRSLLKNDSEEIAVDFMNQSIVVMALQQKITHLFVPALAPVTLFTLSILKDLGIKTIHWFIEDFRRATYWKDVISGYTDFIAIQKGPIIKKCEEVGVNYHFLPTATELNDRETFPNNLPKFDISFIGIPSEYRIDFLESLVDTNISMQIAGSGWKNYSGKLDKFIIKKQWVNKSESSIIFNSCRIALNLSFENPELDRANCQISPRVFDIFANNATLLTENLPLLKDTVRGYEYLSFNNISEAINIITEYSDTIDTQKNFNLINKQDTWKNRAEEIIDICI